MIRWEKTDRDVLKVTGKERGYYDRTCDDGLDAIATRLAMKYFIVVHFVCLPYEEYLEKKCGMLIFKIQRRKVKCSMDRDYAFVLAEVSMERAGRQKKQMGMKNDRYLLCRR